MARKGSQPAPIFLAGILTVTILGFGHVVTLFLLPSMRTRFVGLILFAHSVNWIVLFGTQCYMLGRFFAAMPYWRPGARRAWSWITVLRYVVNFFAVSVALTPVGIVFGVAAMLGASDAAWEVPMLVLGLICGHFAWIWADRHGDRVLRAVWPGLSWPDKTADDHAS